ncbi:MAG TPA: HD domain-containing phosphohydrolase [Solirubrobacteraceae bacterium]|nr:HD domain-containing phosphohydrolase [Solirubrobacteraceae bacterium]
MLSTGYDLEPVLRAVARTTATFLGFGTAVINMYRPAWDDFHTVVVEGNDQARRLLLGQSSVADDWAPLLEDRFKRRGAYLIRHGDFDWSRDRLTTYIPNVDLPVDADGWHPEDALFVPLRSSSGEVLGILSVDEPLDGKRPGADKLDLLVGMSQHAAIAIEHAQQAVAAERQRVAVDHLLRLTASLAERRTVDEMLDAVCTGIRDALGFGKVVVAIADGGVFDLRAVVGMPEVEQARLSRIPVAAIAPLLDPALERDGVIFTEREDAEARVDPSLHDASQSRANGRGGRAWINHVLLVPLRDREGGLEGVVWVDDPVDRLLPTAEMLRALRAFANHAMSAIDSARQLELMRHLAEHDPLTGLRNRRGLQEHIDVEIERVGRVAVIVCDLDNFKRVNDALGYVRGDEALRRFAGVLAEAGGLAARLGGEEFALVLPGAGEDEAMAIAERVRCAVPAAFADFPWPVTTSAGVAVSGTGAETASLLLRAATRAVFGAKRLGRDRCVAYHAETLDSLLGSLEEDGAGEQLAAAMLLAETLDLRDVSTARHSQTVGRLAEGIARALGLGEERVQRIRAAGVLHDIGKLGVADAILKKPGALTDEEWTEMRRHPELGARILHHANLRDISGWVLAHHERLDGRGYPAGLAGDAIPLEARILAVADAYEAMTADRPYRTALGHDAARAELQAAAGTQFDPVVVDAFLRALAPKAHRAAARVPSRPV